MMTRIPYNNKILVFYLYNYREKIFEGDAKNGKYEK